MKTTTLILLTTLFSLLSANTQAAGEEKPLSLGIGTYALVLVYENDNFADDDFSGTAFSLSYATSNHLAFRGTLYSIEHNDFSTLENDGYDLTLLIGTGLNSRGLKLYAGGGFFNETWELGAGEEDFGGIQFTGGVGYNWDNIGLDFWLSMRDSGDYDDFIGGDPAAVSGSLTLSIRI